MRQRQQQLAKHNDRCQRYPDQGRQNRALRNGHGNERAHPVIGVHKGRAQGVVEQVGVAHAAQDVNLALHRGAVRRGRNEAAAVPTLAAGKEADQGHAETQQQREGALVTAGVGKAVFEHGLFTRGRRDADIDSAG